MTRQDIDTIISIICPNDEDFEKTCISPAYLKKELEVLALEQEPCEDAVSRASVFEILGNLMSIPYDLDRPINKDDVSESMDAIRVLPSVTPAPKKCHNENHDYAECDQFVCSNCGIELQDWHRVERDENDGDVTYHEYEFKYCPNCGAKIDKRTLEYANQNTMMSAT